MKNKASIARLILALSIAIPGIFFVSMLTFFMLNAKAYAQTPLLTLLQFNIKGVAYTFIPGVFGYALVGAAITLLWALVWRSVLKMRAASLGFALSGVLLMTIGAKPSLQEEVAPLFYLSILFIALNLVGLVILLAKSTVVLNKWVLALLLAFVIYELVNRFILFKNGFDLNALISICFVWYLYLFKYLKTEFDLKLSHQTTLS
jgi:hypothetical protein